MTEIISKGNATMELIGVLAVIIALNAVARRWGVDSRDNCDWGDTCAASHHN